MTIHYGISLHTMQTWQAKYTTLMKSITDHEQYLPLISTMWSSVYCNFKNSKGLSNLLNTLPMFPKQPPRQSRSLSCTCTTHPSLSWKCLVLHKTPCKALVTLEQYYACPSIPKTLLIELAVWQKEQQWQNEQSWTPVKHSLSILTSWPIAILPAFLFSSRRHWKRFREIYCRYEAWRF